MLALAVALGAFGTGCCGASASAPAAASGGTRPLSQRVPGEYLVTLAPGAGAEAIEAAFGSLGLKRVDGLGGSRYLVTVREDPGPERMRAIAAKDARIEAVQPNLVYRGLGT
jgi:hypothetical protein